MILMDLLETINTFQYFIIIMYLTIFKNPLFYFQQY